jgi:cellulose synthase (UDP-forming)
VAIAAFFPHGNRYLFAIFLVGEVFHLWQILTYTYTIWNVLPKPTPASFDQPVINVFITVAGEPVELVRTTILAAQAIDYPNYSIHILNDGFVAKKDNWQDVEALATELGVECITRRIPGGAKAGNINHALGKTTGELVAIFDADHVPVKDIFNRMVGHFNDTKMGFVQSPQYYGNYATNYITGGAWEQQELFFGPLLRGKDRLNAAFMCGTNMLISRAALEDVGGMCETNIAEDFLTSLFLHEKGWTSAYVPEVLASGLAPEDFSSYYKQQYRWARGSLEVIFKYNPLTRRGLSWAQRLQYLASASYYLTGFIVLMNALLPIVFFFTGLVVFNITTMALAAVFIPYIFISLLTLQQSSNFTFTFRALAFSYGSFWLQMLAVGAVLTNRKTSFAVTSKQQVSGNFLYLVVPNIAYIVLVVAGASYATYRYGLNASVVTNIAWAALNVGLFLPLIIAASPLGVRPNHTKHQVSATKPAHDEAQVSEVINV